MKEKYLRTSECKRKKIKLRRRKGIEDDEKKFEFRNKIS